MWDDMKEFVIFLSGILLLAAVMICLLVGVLNLVHRYQCSNYERITGKQTQFEWFVGCYIQTDAGWELWEEYKARATASEGLKDE